MSSASPFLTLIHIWAIGATVNRIILDGPVAKLAVALEYATLGTEVAKVSALWLPSTLVAIGAVSNSLLGRGGWRVKGWRGLL